MNKNIDELFNKAKSESEMFSMDEVHHLLEKNYPSSFYKRLSKKINRNNKMGLIASTAVAVIITATLGGAAYFASDNDAEISSGKTAIVTQQDSEQDTKANNENDDEKLSRNMIIASEDISESQPSNENRTEKIHHFGGKLDVKGVNLIQLEESELENLGIVVDEDNAIEFAAKETEQHPVVVRLEKNGNWKLIMGREVDPDMPTLFPRFITDGSGNRLISMISKDDKRAIISAFAKSTVIDKKQSPFIHMTMGDEDSTESNVETTFEKVDNVENTYLMKTVNKEDGQVNMTIEMYVDPETGTSHHKFSGLTESVQIPNNDANKESIVRQIETELLAKLKWSELDTALVDPIMMPGMEIINGKESFSLNFSRNFADSLFKRFQLRIDTAKSKVQSAMAIVVESGDEKVISSDKDIEILVNNLKANKFDNISIPENLVEILKQKMSENGESAEISKEFLDSLTRNYSLQWNADNSGTNVSLTTVYSSNDNNTSSNMSKSIIISDNENSDSEANTLDEKYQERNVINVTVQEQLGETLEELEKVESELGLINKHLESLTSFESINKLIPIAAKLDPENPTKTTFILWFDPSDKLAEQLPEEIRKRLAIELKALNSDDYCNNDAIAGEEVFADVWRKCSGAVENLNVFPNPSSGQFSVNYHLNNERNVSVALHDMFGNKIKELSRYSKQPSGAKAYNYTVKDLTPGMYLVVVQTEKGEQAVQRIIVE